MACCRGSYFFRIMSMTADKIKTIPTASLNVKASLKTKVLMMTAVTGSNAPRIEAGVQPICLMAIFIK